MRDNPKTTGVDSAFGIFDGGGEAKNHLVLALGPAVPISHSFSWRERALIANSLFSTCPLLLRSTCLLLQSLFQSLNPLLLFQFSLLAIRDVPIACPLSQPALIHTVYRLADMFDPAFFSSLGDNPELSGERA
jgi:hypothetical protein